MKMINWFLQSRRVNFLESTANSRRISWRSTSNYKRLTISAKTYKKRSKINAKSCDQPTTVVSASQKRWLTNSALRQSISTKFTRFRYDRLPISWVPAMARLETSTMPTRNRGWQIEQSILKRVTPPGKCSRWQRLTNKRMKLPEWTPFFFWPWQTEMLTSVLRKLFR